MKTDSRHKTSAGSMFRFFLRGLGLTGLLTFVAGAVLASSTWPELSGEPRQAWHVASEAMKGPLGEPAKVAAFLILISAGAVVAWLLIEVVSGLFLVTGRKSGAGVNNTAQMALAVALVVVVNAISFQHYSRNDATRDKRFTLAPELQDQLRKLDPKSPTTIVVLQMDKTSAAEPDRSDALSSAAQAKIVEKVRDLVEEIREFGPQFDVHVLHTKDEEFDGKLDALTKVGDDRELAKKSKLRTAIQTAPENSIFFYHDGRVQRLAFNQFYLLDKTASRPEGKPDERNLVLIPQGKEAFVRKVISVESRRPKVALAVIHPVLTSKYKRDEYSTPGVRKSLELNGYDVVDLVLKKGWDGESPLGPAASSIRESELEKVEARLQLALDDFAEAEAQLQQLKLVREKTLKGTLAELDRLFRRVVGRPIDEEADRKRLLDRVVDPNIALRESDLADAKKRQAKYEPEYLEFTRDDALMAARRDPNIKARLRETLAECDLLILSRLTVMTLAERRSVPPGLHNLSKDQAEGIKEYLASGKPAICCFGAGDLGPVQQRPDEPSGPDDVEKLIRRLGVVLGPQVIVTDIEYEGMAEQRTDQFATSEDPPPLRIQDPVKLTPNPVAHAFELSNRALAGQLNVVRSGFRPVYFDPAAPATATAEILHTAPESWNKNWPDTAPFGSPRYLPKFEATKPTDERKGTRNEERKGSFPIGVAVEVPVPAEWLDDKNAVAAYAASIIGAAAGSPPGFAFATTNPDRFQAAMNKNLKTTRIVVFGHGGLFVGKELDPGRETLLLQSVHWSLNRETEMPRGPDAAGTWQYPRIKLAPVEYSAWRWGTFLGLPLLAAYFGLIVLMLRRLR